MVIHHLRQAAKLATLAAYHTDGLADRCDLTRLVALIDEYLILLLNSAPREDRKRVLSAILNSD